MEEKNYHYKFKLTDKVKQDENSNSHEYEFMVVCENLQDITVYWFNDNGDIGIAKDYYTFADFVYNSDNGYWKVIDENMAPIKGI